MSTLPVLNIFGDSFAASNDPSSWVTLLRQHYNVVNHASNGSSEYRIWKNYNSAKPGGLVLFCHTSPSRIFLKDSSESESRKLLSHPKCDIILNDVYAKKERKFIDTLETIWDEDYFNDTYNLLVSNLKAVPQSVHICFFNSDFTSIWQKYPGTVNHLSEEGNKVVFNLVASALANLS